MDLIKTLFGIKVKNSETCNENSNNINTDSNNISINENSESIIKETLWYVGSVAMCYFVYDLTKTSIIRYAEYKKPTPNPLQQIDGFVDHFKKRYPDFSKKIMEDFYKNRPSNMKIVIDKKDLVELKK
jgi:hypothetical protein